MNQIGAFKFWMPDCRYVGTVGGPAATLPNPPCGRWVGALRTPRHHPRGFSFAPGGSDLGTAQAYRAIISSAACDGPGRCATSGPGVGRVPLIHRRLHTCGRLFVSHQCITRIRAGLGDRWQIVGRPTRTAGDVPRCRRGPGRSVPPSGPRGFRDLPRIVTRRCRGSSPRRRARASAVRP